MPRINPHRLIDTLEGLLTMTHIAWALSKNTELTEHLDQMKEKLEQMIITLTKTFPTENVPK